MQAQLVVSKSYGRLLIDCACPHLSAKGAIRRDGAGRRGRARGIANGLKALELRLERTLFGLERCNLLTGLAELSLELTDLFLHRLPFDKFGGVASVANKSRIGNLKQDIP